MISSNFKLLKGVITVCPPQGDCEDHATLLCSLLLGFGLDAYVCVGTKAKGTPHTWVLTRGTDGSITFWESLTAHRSLFYFIIVIETTSVTQLLLLLPCPSGIKPESLQQLGHMRKCSILLILMCLIPLTKDVCAYLGKKMKLKL